MSSDSKKYDSGCYIEQFEVDWAIKKLAVEILARAASDLMGGEDAYREYKTSAKRLLQKDAAAWFESDSNDWVFSFIGICDLAGLHPDWVRKMIKLGKINAVRRSISMGRA
jgi:hypothetical protein